MGGNKYLVCIHILIDSSDAVMRFTSSFERYRLRWNFSIYPRFFDSQTIECLCIMFANVHVLQQQQACFCILHSLFRCFFFLVLLHMCTALHAHGNQRRQLLLFSFIHKTYMKNISLSDWFASYCKSWEEKKYTSKEDEEEGKNPWTELDRSLRADAYKKWVA